jgi:hypothetical protein
MDFATRLGREFGRRTSLCHGAADIGSLTLRFVRGIAEPESIWDRVAHRGTLGDVREFVREDAETLLCSDVDPVAEDDVLIDRIRRRAEGSRRTAGARIAVDADASEVGAEPAFELDSRCFI